MTTDQVREAMQWMPFLGLMNKTKADGSMLQHPLTIRLAEAAIIGAVVMYGTVQKTEIKLEHLNSQISQLREETTEIRKQLRIAEQELWRREGLNKLHLAWRL
jgi:hypothetical protein